MHHSNLRSADRDLVKLDRVRSEIEAEFPRSASPNLMSAEARARAIERGVLALYRWYTAHSQAPPETGIPTPVSTGARFGVIIQLPQAQPRATPYARAGGSRRGVSMTARLAAFQRDIDDVINASRAAAGERDIRHARFFLFLCRLTEVAGFALGTWSLNPFAPMLIALAQVGRWGLAHQILHCSYDGLRAVLTGCEVQGSRVDGAGIGTGVTGLSLTPGNTSTTFTM